MPINYDDCAATYKVLIIGDSGVGKSAILNCLMGKEFDERSRPTVGMDFVTKILEADGALIELRIWDSAGLEDFRSLTRKQFQGTQGVIAVYDVTNRTSFENMEYWISAVPNTSSSCSTRYSYEPIPFVVVANKADLSDRKKVGIMEGMKMAKKSMAFGFYEVSAKTGKDVFTIFHNLAFTITDINHPKLMKSYHPHLIRPMGTTEDVMNSSLPEPAFTLNIQSAMCHPPPHSSLLSSSTLQHSSTSALPYTKSPTKPTKKEKTSSSKQTIKPKKLTKGSNPKKQETTQVGKPSTENCTGFLKDDPKLTNTDKGTQSRETDNPSDKANYTLCSCFGTKKNGQRLYD